MLSITPCQRIISDRFPVASFVVNAPPQRLFEIACATDPTLFHPDQRHRRTTDNFFTTRLGGLLRAPAGHATYLVPPEQLRRFAGARRLFYNAGSYSGPSGEDARFNVAPEAAELVPSIQIAPDFTGKSLDRSRLGGSAARADARYGAPSNPEQLTWGADLAAAKGRALGGGEAADGGYDDGHSPKLRQRQSARARGALGTADGNGVGAAPVTSVGFPIDEPPGFEDAPHRAAQLGVAAPGMQLPGSSYGGVAVARYGAAGGVDPAGFEDGAALHRHATGVYGGSGEGVAQHARPSSVEPTGFEDVPALARARAPRYGSVARAFADDPPRASPEVAPLPAPTLVASPAAVGRDDEYDDSAVEAEEPELPVDLPGNEVRTSTTLTIPEKFKIVRLVATSEGGSGHEAYSAVNRDGEYNDSTHAFYRRRHVGLSWGIVQATQVSGALGRTLRACQRRDPEEFERAFGPDAQELLRVTGAELEADRLAPVGAGLLWEGTWPERFARAGQLTSFQAAQNEVAIEGYLDENLGVAAFLGWNTDRALAILYDRAVHMGNVAARRWILRIVGPIRTQRQRSAALAALGFASMQAFADGVPELAGDARWTPLAHAALAGALSTLGNAGPVPLPTLTEQLDRVVTAAGARRFRGRVERLRSSRELGDITYQLLG